MDSDAAEVLGWLEEVVELLVRPADGAAAPGAAPSSATTVASFFSPGDDCWQEVARQFRHARSAADVCVFTITDDRIADAILDAHRRGVRIRVVSDDEKSHDPGSDIPRFAAAGIPTKIDHSPAHMHHKFAIFDGRLLLNGSFNWTRAASAGNEENLIASTDPGLIAAFQKRFDVLWSKFEVVR